MKTRKSITTLCSMLLLLAGLFTTQVSYADCINSCGNINDGRCGSLVSCENETDPEKVNCNRFDSVFGCPQLND
tara:strand:- start:2582 stop:2803 length:222 start_codon:yes stop_codon:yes gene_type:complete